MAMGHMAPPTLPIMFMAPEIVPAYLPPTSMQAPHEPGITRSFEKLANPIAIIAATGLARWTDRTRSALAPVTPMNAITFRVAATLCVRRVNGAEIAPMNND